MKGYISKRYIGLIALGVVLILAITFFVQAATIYEAQVIAKEKGSAIGMAPFTDRIDFGDIPQGEMVRKTLVMENAGSVPNSVNIFVMGGISDLVEVEPESVTLEAGETVEINFTLRMPASVEPEAKFSGRVIVLRLPKGLW